MTRQSKAIRLAEKAKEDVGKAVNDGLRLDKLKVYEMGAVLGESFDDDIHEGFQSVPRWLIEKLFQYLKQFSNWLDDRLGRHWEKIAVISVVVLLLFSVVCRGQVVVTEKSLDLISSNNPMLSSLWLYVKWIILGALVGGVTVQREGGVVGVICETLGGVLEERQDEIKKVALNLSDGTAKFLRKQLPQLNIVDENRLLNDFDADGLIKLLLIFSYDRMRDAVTNSIYLRQQPDGDIMNFEDMQSELDSIDVAQIGSMDYSKILRSLCLVLLVRDNGEVLMWFGKLGKHIKDKIEKLSRDNNVFISTYVSTRGEILSLIESEPMGVSLKYVSRRGWAEVRGRKTLRIIFPPVADKPMVEMKVERDDEGEVSHLEIEEGDEKKNYFAHTHSSTRRLYRDGEFIGESAQWKAKKLYEMSQESPICMKTSLNNWGRLGAWVYNPKTEKSRVDIIYSGEVNAHREAEAVIDKGLVTEVKLPAVDGKPEVIFDTSDRKNKWIKAIKVTIDGQEKKPMIYKQIYRGDELVWSSQRQVLKIVLERLSEDGDIVLYPTGIIHSGRFGCGSRHNKILLPVERFNGRVVEKVEIAEGGLYSNITVKAGRGEPQQELQVLRERKMPVGIKIEGEEPWTYIILRNKKGEIDKVFKSTQLWSIKYYIEKNNFEGTVENLRMSGFDGWRYKDINYWVEGSANKSLKVEFKRDKAGKTRPRWLYVNGKKKDAEKAGRKITTEWKGDERKKALYRENKRWVLSYAWGYYNSIGRYIGMVHDEIKGKRHAPVELRSTALESLKDAINRWDERWGRTLSRFWVRRYIAPGFADTVKEYIAQYKKVSVDEQAKIGEMGRLERKYRKADIEWTDEMIAEDMGITHRELMDLREKHDSIFSKEVRGRMMDNMLELSVEPEIEDGGEIPRDVRYEVLGYCEDEIVRMGAERVNEEVIRRVAEKLGVTEDLVRQVLGEFYQEWGDGSSEFVDEEGSFGFGIGEKGHR